MDQRSLPTYKGLLPLNNRARTRQVPYGKPARDPNEPLEVLTIETIRHHPHHHSLAIARVITDGPDHPHGTVISQIKLRSIKNDNHSPPRVEARRVQVPSLNRHPRPKLRSRSLAAEWSYTTFGTITRLSPRKA